jgi:hypothetical protein
MFLILIGICFIAWVCFVFLFLSGFSRAAKYGHDDSGESTKEFFKSFFYATCAAICIVSGILLIVLRFFGYLV